MTRLLSNLVFFAFSILFLNSCFLRDAIMYPECRGECAELSGVILTGDGTEPVEDVLIKLRWYDYTYGSFVKDEIIAKVRTNSNGFYILKFDAKTKGHYQVIIENNHDYFKLHDREFHEFYLPDITNDSSIVRNYMMPYKAKMVITFEKYSIIENYHWLNILFPLGVNFSQGYGYPLSWSESHGDYKYQVEVAAEVPISLEKVIVINDSTYIRHYDTIYIKRNEIHHYDLDFQHN